MVRSHLTENENSTREVIMDVNGTDWARGMG